MAGGQGSGRWRALLRGLVSQLLVVIVTLAAIEVVLRTTPPPMSWGDPNPPVLPLLRTTVDPLGATITGAMFDWICRGSSLACIASSVLLVN